MKKLIRLAFMAAAFIAAESTALAQTAPTIAWDKTFGGNLDDRLTSMAPTSDGGYILGGWSKSGISGDKSQVNKGSSNTPDYWIVKVDANGVKQWDKTFGGDAWDQLESIQQTADGGYILGGYSTSGQTGDKSEPNRSTTADNDYWIVKTDANGVKQWDKTFGGNVTDVLATVKQTPDGGYILGGYSNSPISGDKSQAVAGNGDMWIVKVDASGNKQWDKTYGGSAGDTFYNLDLTSDGGYIIGGTSVSPISGDKSQAQIGANDYWIVKIDAAGNKQWDKTFGGTNVERLLSVKQLRNGGYLLSGWSNSGISGDKSQASKGLNDFWVVRIDASGNKIWDKTIGGNSDDYLEEFVERPDGTFILGGSSMSNISGDKSQNNIGGPIEPDYWVVKIDASGNKIWDKTVGAGSSDGLLSLSMNINSEILLAGYSNSGSGGNKTQTNYGGWDYWIVKLNPTCADLTATLAPTCGTSGADVNVNVSGIQPVTTGTPSWTLTYTVNGVTQTATGTTNTFSLATNAAVGTVYTLVSIASGTCTNTLTGTFTVQAVPSAPTVTPGNSCGTGTVTLSASGAPAGGTYIWYDAATAGNALQTSASNTFTTPSLTANTPYFVAVTNNAGCESPRTQVMATITNLSVTAGAAQTICESAAPVQLSGYSPAGGTFSGPGVSASGLFTPNSSLRGNQTITYTVTQNGCTDSATQVITVVAAPVVSAGINDTVCASAAPFQFTGASPAGGTWSGSGVNATGLFTPTHALAGSQTLTYSVSQNGCTVTSTKNVVIPTPPVQPVISLHTSDTLIASTLGNSYEWKRNNTVIPGNQQKLKVSTPGTYAVRVKDAANCASEYSADYNYNVSGLKDELQNNFSLYPNPTSGMLTLELSKPQPAEVSIYNALGQQILQKTVAKTDEKVQLDLSTAAKGIYLVQVKTEKQVVVKKVVVE